MSRPITAGERNRAFRKWGIEVNEPDGWKTHNRNAHGKWGPVHGIIIHHTGDDAPDNLDFKILWKGRSDLPGPLCHWGMRDNGEIDQIGNGRANHAGMGASKVLDAVISEIFGDYPPRPVADTEDGNQHFYGQETYFSGGRPMTNAAYNSTIRACAAICEFHGWTEKSVIGHKEWTSRKPDPGRTDMAELRRDVKAALKMGAKKASTYNFRSN